MYICAVKPSKLSIKGCNCFVLTVSMCETIIYLIDSWNRLN